MGKLVAARDAIGDADFFLVARTDARGTSAKNGLEDAIRRANLYIVSVAQGACFFFCVCVARAPRTGWRAPCGAPTRTL